MGKDNPLIAVSVAMGFGLSFLGLGIFWIGLPFYVEATFGLVFFGLTYVLARNMEIPFRATLAVIGGALPIGALLTMFRDRNDSHLKPILLVAIWFLASALGSWVAARRRAVKPA